MFRPLPGVRYDMPVVFGPSHVPNVTLVREIRTIALSFVTDAEALRPFIPYHFAPVADPVVTLSSSMNIGVDHLGGRSYNVVRLMADVMARNEDGTSFRAPYHFVIWESRTQPITIGREFQGYAKLQGEIPDHEVSEAAASFRVGEYETDLLSGRVTDLSPLSQAAVDKMNETPRALAVGWKYIPGPELHADVDYPTRLVAYRTVSAGWRGTGSFDLAQVTAQQCPISHRIVAALRSWPVLEMRPALRLITNSRLSRDEVVRLPSWQEEMTVAD